MFNTGFEKDLQPHADGKHGPATGHPATNHADGIDGLEFLHDSLVSADAGNYQAIGVEDVLRLGAQQDVGTGAFQCADSGTDVARAIVQHRYGGLAFR